MRGHQPVSLDKFMGLYQRGDRDNTPLDHFQDCNNLMFNGSGTGFKQRPGLSVAQDVAIPLQNIKRIYNYPTNTANTLIVLVINDAGEGEIYHVVNSTTTFGPILTIADMVDFAFVPYAGRGYISPIGYYVQGELNIEKGLEDEFLYVYAGDGTAARKAAGLAPTGNMSIANGAAGHTDPGLHIFGVVYETISGYLSPPGLLETFTTLAGFSVSFGNIPTSGDPNVVARHIVASKAITGYDGNLTGYDLFFIPDGTIPNNTATFINNVSFFDADLLDDASHLHDNFEEIPAGAVLTIYHNRLCLFTTFDEITVGYISAIGEPEAIDQVDGVIVMPPDGNPITNAQELRDVLYTTKRSKTGSFMDNGDDPATWPYVIVDNALGSCIHGIATVLDSGSSSVDYLIICTFQGISIFNGKYITPELSWKVEEFWRILDNNEFRRIQIINTPIQKWILVVLPDQKMLLGDYGMGLDPKNMRWSPWSFIMPVNTVAVKNIDDIVIGSELYVP